jgi:tektin-3
MSRFCSASPISRHSPGGACSPPIAKVMPMISEDHDISRHNVMQRSGTLINSKHFYNTGRNAVYSRYTTSDWETSNKAHYNLADKERSLAEQLRNEAFRTVKVTDRQTRSRQAANTKRLSERVSDITMWKEELNTEIHADETEMENMKEYIRVLERALADTAQPLAIAEECLTQRESRTGVDQVHDDVERSLTKEIEVIKKCQQKMKNILERAAVQQKMTRAAQHACDMDARNKQHAQELDDRMHQLHNSSSGIGLFPGIETYDNTVSIPASWLQFTQENLARAQKEREASVKLRGDMDALMRQCANDMWNQFNCVNNSFGARVQETKDAKNKMQAHLQKTVGEIKEMERTIAFLRKAIQDKEAPMKVAQTRLDERTRRIDIELCNDPAMQGLQKEVDEIRQSIQVLKAKLREAENALVRLLKTRASLEQDIMTKDRSLDIDAKSCQGMRKNMPMDPKTGPMIIMPMLM